MKNINEKGREKVKKQILKNIEDTYKLRIKIYKSIGDLEKCESLKKEYEDFKVNGPKEKI